MQEKRINDVQKLDKKLENADGDDKTQIEQKKQKNLEKMFKY